MTTPANNEPRHFTARRSFVIFVGLLVLTLYFVWAGYGAAPVNLGFLAETEKEPTPGMGMSGMGMGGHGSGTGKMTPEKFQEITEKFVEDLSLADGSVRPTRKWMVAMEMPAATGRDQRVAQGTDEGEDPIDVYIMAMRFSYTPRVLRLEKGVSYRFRMMSMDVNHGASIHTGFAGHIMRRPAQVMVEMVMTFSTPGEFMMYCTVYCGEGHSKMKGKIIVE